MTEEVWLGCDDVGDMVEHIGLAASARKVRLLGCACVRWAWEWGMGEPTPEAICVGEAFADGVATAEEVSLAAREMNTEWREHEEAYRPYPRTCEWTEMLLDTDARAWLGELHPYTADMHIGDEPEWQGIVRFAHDIFGNPFRPVAFDPAWRSDTAVSLAKQMYESRDFDAMPILADALQDAGCDNADILNHCRDPQQTHVRGCWVVDLVLNKS
ncbi:MAG: hypothetical protein U0792_01285 [Gemmataceae bacterium]